MPWREVSAMEQRREFVRLAMMEGVNRRELCRRFGISPQIGYKWLDRARAGDGDLAFARGATAAGPAWRGMTAESGRYLVQAWKAPVWSLAPAMDVSLDAFAFWSRMMSLGVAWQSAMLAPLHAAATANARRLGSGA